MNKSTLSQLRLSKIDKDLMKSNGENNRSDKITPEIKSVGNHSTPSSSSSSNRLSLDLNDSSRVPLKKNVEKLTVSKDDLKKANELTSLFLDSRKILRADCNIIDNTNNTKINDHDHLHSDISSSSISRSTMIRAEKVKTMIGVKYYYIQRLHEWSESHGEENEHPGVEGVYNPLQIIRNRKIRSKYKEYPKQMHLKIPMACNVFSKYNQPEYLATHHHKKPWRMLYAIELNEFIGDTRWRVNHWHELKDPKGNLWFPVESTKKRDLLKQRLHDKLFEDEYNKKPNRKHHHRGGSSTTSGSDSDVHLFKIPRSKSPKRSIKHKMKNFYKGDSSSSSDVNNELNENSTNFHIFKRVPNNNGNHSDSSDEKEVSVKVSTKSTSSQPPPVITISSTTPDVNSVQNVEFNHTSRKPSEDMVENVESQPRSMDCLQVIDQRERDFVQVQSNLDYFQQCCELKRQYLINIYPLNLELITSKINRITKEQIFHTFNQISSINDELLPRYEELYCGFIEESKSIIHMINDNYSIKIDTLLSNSDRSLSDISATLSLDLRKITEKLDILETSLIKSKTINGDLHQSHRQRHHHQHQHSINNYKFLYLFLENFIIILLRLIWVIVNVLKIFLFLFKLVWKVFRFII